MSVEDRKIKLVVKTHGCERVGELSSWLSVDLQSIVNGVGNGVLQAAYGASDRDDAILDRLDTADMILEAYVKPPGHDAFLTDPVWQGLLRDRKIDKDGLIRVGTYFFKTPEHLLERRLIKPPEGASHDEEYGPRANVMRGLVRRHAAELAESDRAMPGLSVEADDETDAGSGFYGDDTGLVFGSNRPEYVRANALFTWNNFLYVGLQTQPDSGEYAAIWRTSDGDNWTQVYDGSPGATYENGVTSINCFAEFDGELYTGCSQEWGHEEALVLRSPDGATWARSGYLPATEDCATDGTETNGYAGCFSLAAFGGELFAGITVYAYTYDAGNCTFTYLWKSVDGSAWSAVETVTVNASSAYFIRCNALYSWEGNLYVGLTHKWWTWYRYQYQAVIMKSADGTLFSTAWSRDRVAGEGVLSFLSFEGMLYAGTGRTRWSPFSHLIQDFAGMGFVGVVGITNIDWANGGQIWRSADGGAWNQVFGGNLNSQHVSGAISALLEVEDDEGLPTLWVASGWRTGGRAFVYRSYDGVEWNKIIEIRAIEYAYCLSLATLGSEHYAATGSYAKSGEWHADHGDVWRVVPADPDMAESGMAGRWVTLLSKLQEIANESGSHDFGLVPYDTLHYCADDVQNWQFQVRTPQWGTNRRWSEEDGGLTFQIERGNLERHEERNLRGSRPNFWYILATGAGEEREIHEFPNPVSINESPWNRVEGAADAQGMDNAASVQSVGWALLDQEGPKNEVEVKVLETDRCHYLGDWFLGDIVTVST